MTRVARLPGLVTIAQDLGKVLAARGYTPSSLSGALADAYRIAPDHFEAAVLARRLDSSQLATLVTVFLAGSAVPEADVADTVQPLAVDALIGAGLLTWTGELLQAAVRIGWCDGLLVCHDWHDGRAAHREDVVGVAQASLTLADLTVRLPDG
jgi:hypothetical protein